MVVNAFLLALSIMCIFINLPFLRPTIWSKIVTYVHSRNISFIGCGCWRPRYPVLEFLLFAFWEDCFFVYTCFMSTFGIKIYVDALYIIDLYIEQVACSLCSETMEREILAVHKGENCPQRIVTCEFCEFPLPAVDLAEHQVGTSQWFRNFNICFCWMLLAYLICTLAFLLILGGMWESDRTLSHV